MPLIRFDQYRAMRPNWCPLEDAGAVMLDAGEGTPLHFADRDQWYFIVDGRLDILDGADRMTGEPGEVLLVRAGTPHALLKAIEPTLLLRVVGASYPPYRDGESEPGAPAPALLSPASPPLSPKRRGVAVRFDESATFSPMMLAGERGGDLLILANPGAMGKAQVREIRTHCLEAQRALAGLIVEFETDRDAIQFIADPFQGGMALELRPLTIATPADLATLDGRSRAAAIRTHWTPRLRVDGIRPCALMPYRAWTESELLGIFNFLRECPPAAFGVILTVDAQSANSDFRMRRALDALLPWTSAVVYESRDGGDQFAHYLECAGYQGWVLQRII